MLGCRTEHTTNFCWSLPSWVLVRPARPREILSWENNKILSAVLVLLVSSALIISPSQGRHGHTRRRGRMSNDEMRLGRGRWTLLEKITENKMLRLFSPTCSHPPGSENYDEGAGRPGGHREHGGSLPSWEHVPSQGIIRHLQPGLQDLLSWRGSLQVSFMTILKLFIQLMHNLRVGSKNLKAKICAPSGKERIKNAKKKHFAYWVLSIKQNFINIF